VQSQQVSSILEKHSDLFESLRPSKPDIWLLYSYSSINLAYVEGSNTKGSVRSIEQHSNALFGAYSMLRDIGFSSLFIDEANLKKIQTLPSSSIIIVPGAYALEANTIYALRDFVKNGGILVTDGVFALKDRFGRQQIDAMPVVSEMIGTCLSDIITTQDTFSLSIKGITAPGWYVKNRFSNFTTGKVIGMYDDDGEPSIIENHLGLGKVYHIATKFFEYYTENRNLMSCELLKALLPAKQVTSIRLCNPKPGLHAKSLIGNKHDLLIIFNHNTNGCIGQLYSPRQAYLYSLIDNDNIRISAGSFVNVQMQPMQVNVYRIDWE
jgi:hypothetical protein